MRHDGRRRRQLCRLSIVCTALISVGVESFHYHGFHHKGKYALPTARSGGKTVMTRTRGLEMNAVSQAAQGHHNAALAGRMFPILSKIASAPAKAKGIYAATANAIDLPGLILLSILGWATIPFANAVCDRFPKFESRRGMPLIRALSEIGQIGALVYAADIFVVVLNAIGIHFPLRAELSLVLAKVAYCTWFAVKICALKKISLRKMLRKARRKIGVLDRLLDAFIWILATLFIMDSLSIQVGKGLGSVFTVGGVGTIVVGLASQELATQLVSGLMLSISEAFAPGDKVVFNDGKKVSVVDMGFLDTSVRRDDEVIVKIPNSQLVKGRVSNLSRLKKSQVKQSLYFKHSDWEKMPQVIADIKACVKEACPKIITNGRPFRAHVRDIKEDRIEVVVDFHFNIPGGGDAYLEMRQEVLSAITRAVKMNGVEFALPRASVLHTGCMS